MLFKSRFHSGIRDGSITLTFRAWTRPQATAGSRQRFGSYDGTRAASGFLEIDAVDLVPVSSITDEQARLSGFTDRAALLAELARTSRERLRDESSVYRVSLRYVDAPDEREQLARDDELSADESQMIAEKLSRMDARSRGGSWTRETLALIQRRSGVSATKLAQQLGRETQPFKADVRKLKALGLTMSLEVGYELSPRGRAFLRARRRPSPRLRPTNARRAP